MRICRLQEIFPEGIPLACINKLNYEGSELMEHEYMESGSHAWLQDNQGRMCAICEPTPYGALMTNDGIREQECPHIQEQALPEVPMTLQGQLMLAPDSRTSIPVSILFGCWGNGLHDGTICRKALMRLGRHDEAHAT